MTLRLNRKRLTVISLVVLQAAIVCAFVWLRLGVEVGIPKEGETITFSTGTPDETKVDKQTYEWVGLDAEPKYIYLPTIGSEGFIQKVGVDQNKQVAVPNNIHFAGWFTDSSLPGRRGLSVIDGHVTGRYNDAIFKDLALLKENDQFLITLGSGEVLKYRVLSVKTVSVADSANLLFSQSSGVGSQLNLITCGGNYLDEQSTYDQRVIVAAEYIKE